MTALTSRFDSPGATTIRVLIADDHGVVAEGLRYLIQAQLGHASLAATDRYLRHVAPVQLIEALRARGWEGSLVLAGPHVQHGSDGIAGLGPVSEAEKATRRNASFDHFSPPLRSPL